MDGVHWGFAGTRLLTGQCAASRRLHGGGDALRRDRPFGGRWIPRADADAEGGRQPRLGPPRGRDGDVPVPRRRPLPAGPRAPRRRAQRGHARRGRSARGVPGGLHVLPRRRRVPPRPPPGPRPPRRLRGEHRARDLHLLRQDGHHHRGPAPRLRMDPRSGRLGATAAPRGRDRVAAGDRGSAGRRHPRRGGGPARRCLPAEVLSTFPFTEDRRRETAVVRDEGSRLLVATKGSPEVDPRARRTSTRPAGAHGASACTGWPRAGTRSSAAPRDRSRRARDRAPSRRRATRSRASSSARTACATGVAEAVARCREGGIHTIMVTGDHPATALAVAREIGLGAGEPHVILGEDLGRSAPRGPAGPSRRGRDRARHTCHRSSTSSGPCRRGARSWP